MQGALFSSFFLRKRSRRARGEEGGEMEKLSSFVGFLVFSPSTISGPNCLYTVPLSGLKRFLSTHGRILYEVDLKRPTVS